MKRTSCGRGAALLAFAMLIGSGGAPRTAIAMGQGDKKQAEKIVSNSFTMLLLFSVVLTIVFYAAAPTLLRLFGASDTTLPYALTYSRIFILGTICVLIVLGMNTFITAQGFAKISMLTTVIGAVINIVLDPILIFGLGMGTAGAGLATALSQTISFCILLSMFLRGKTVSQFRLSAVTREPREFLQILAGGAPSFGRQGLNSIGGMLLNIAARSYGDAAVAGMSIVSRIFMFILSVAIGVGQGLQPVASFSFRAASRAFRSSGLVMVAMDARSRVPSGLTDTLPEVSGTCFTQTIAFIVTLASLTSAARRK